MSRTIVAKVKEPEIARLLFRRLLLIHGKEELDTNAKIESLFHLLGKLFVEVTGEEKLQFTTLFARIAYASHRFELSKTLQFYLHSFRKRARKKNTSEAEQQITYILGQKALSESIAAFYQVPIPPDLQAFLPDDGFYQSTPVEIVAYQSLVRAVVLADDPQSQQLLIRDEAHPTEDIRVQYNIADRNENFNPSIKAIREYFDFPLIVNLLEVEIDQQGVYRPRALVIEPDYLIDVSAIAECFKDFGTEPLFYLLKKFLPFESSPALMLGNIANFFLDELMHQPTISYQELTAQLFKLNPLAFATFSDRDLREVLQKAQKHFVHLQRMVQKEFPDNQIEPAHCFLEPTFYSDTFGIQGRLDIFCTDLQKGKESAIVELKSGKAYKPNVYGISANHFTQTLLYDLIIKSTFGKELDPVNYILYSGVDEKQLRFAPVVKAQQFEALQLRNQLLAIEQQLIQIGKQALEKPNFFDLVNAARFPHLKGFVQKDLVLFEQTYQSMSALERKYFVAFSGFIAREQQLAKTGLHGNERRNGQAALWLNEETEKEENYEILSFLKITDNRSRAASPVICFSRTESTNELANFRKGDIAVLYPRQAEVSTPLKNQLFKCTITAIDKYQVEIQLRSRQFNHRLFEQFDYWNLEHDLLDSGFTGMYRSLFSFAQCEPRKKALFLGLEAPQKTSSKNIVAPLALTEQQQEVFCKVLSAEDYFLLWGPPGTGKTSMMLRHLVEWLLNNTTENLLLLAYTNRAVDEICESIERIGPELREEYLRIGSRYATQEAFRGQLLQEQIENIHTRKALKDLIEKRRIIVATVASISGKSELLSMKKFDRVIIDEASQILEPMLVGLLPQFKHCLLIGDHQQLPAVVVQHTELSEVKDEDLQQIGLHNLRDSLFERLYRRCVDQEWTWAYDRLSQQGRMHRDIMDFPNVHFYQGHLQILPEHFDPQNKQTQSIDLGIPDVANDLAERLCQQRLLFFPTPVDMLSTTHKTNRHEAGLICEIVKSYQAIYSINGRSIHAGTIGIITPYRAQIAQIRKALEDQHLDSEALTIDTVERYQGGARDIIILSLCTNQLSQLSALISESGEGVDRRLNVALTRAREQLIVLGNAEILSRNGVYRALMEKGRIDSRGQKK